MAKFNGTCKLNMTAGEIIACCMNCPGSWHNSQVVQGIYEKLGTEMLSRLMQVP